MSTFFFTTWTDIFYNKKVAGLNPIWGTFWVQFAGFLCACVRTKAW